MSIKMLFASVINVIIIVCALLWIFSWSTVDLTFKHPRLATYTPHVATRERAVVVQLFGPGAAADFEAFFPWNDKWFFSQEDVDVVIFYVRYPVNTRDSLMSIIKRMGWKMNRTVDHGVHQWTTTERTTVYTYPLVVNLPQWMAYETASPLDNPSWFVCNGKRWDFEYVVYTAAFVTFLIAHPAVSRYDYWIKVDMDIQFHDQPYVSLVKQMRERQCIMAHTKINGGNEDCQKNRTFVFDKYFRERGLIPLSQEQDWWNTDNYHVYGNMFALKTEWSQSPEVVALTKYLWEDKDVAGYFAHRHTDQATTLHLIGAFFNITTNMLLGREESSVMCDFSSWRHRYFTHH